MTSDEYESLIFPSESDFKAYTRWLFDRAARIVALIDQKYPNLLKNINPITNEEELLPL